MGRWSHESKWGLYARSHSTLDRRRRSGWLISSEGDKMEEFCAGFLLQGNKSPSTLKKKKSSPGFEQTFGVITMGKKNPICFSL